MLYLMALQGITSCPFRVVDEINQVCVVCVRCVHGVCGVCMVCAWCVCMVHALCVHGSLVPRPSPAPIFDRLQYAKTEGEGLVNLTT